MSPTESALLLLPMAVLALLLAPLVGQIVDRAHPRVPATLGFVAGIIGVVWLSLEMTPSSSVLALLVPMAVLGVGSAFMWAPLAATATRNLPMSSAGAGSGVYNATRQVGSVLGSAGIAVLMSSRLAAELAGDMTGSSQLAAQGAQKLPPEIAGGFSDAMAQSLLLPAGILIAGLLAVLLLEGFTHQTRAAKAA
jgi:MFS-type transporter involved in bile tolerance (Atg22 family)